MDLDAMVDLSTPIMASSSQTSSITDTSAPQIIPSTQPSSSALLLKSVVDADMPPPPPKKASVTKHKASDLGTASPPRSADRKRAGTSAASNYGAGSSSSVDPSSSSTSTTTTTDFPLDSKLSFATGDVYRIMMKVLPPGTHIQEEALEMITAAAGEFAALLLDESVALAFHQQQEGGREEEKEKEEEEEEKGEEKGEEDMKGHLHQHQGKSRVGIGGRGGGGDTLGESKPISISSPIPNHDTESEMMETEATRKPLQPQGGGGYGINLRGTDCIEALSVLGFDQIAETLQIMAVHNL